MHINTFPLVRGLASYVIPNKYFTRPGSGGTFSSEYCYSVWLRHLVQLFEKGLVKDLSEIKKVAEIGPGDSLGIGIAALLSGANEYYGFDVIEHANLNNNIKIAEEIKAYFEEHKEIPHKEKQFRNTKPYLKNYDFSDEILGQHISKENLDKRLEEIKNALIKKESKLKIEYVVPWYEKEPDLQGQMDLIYSQAVMEHVEDIKHAYGTMYKWLKPGGIISHQIDFKSHEMTKEWNGHWYINKGMWKMLLHGRKYSINRLPFSAHIKEIEKAGFTVKNIIPDIKENSFGDKKPKVNRYPFTDEDMVTASALIQAVK